MSNPIPGWYPDPTTQGQQRYWDGSRWTEHAAPLPPSAPPMPPPGYAPAPPPYYGYGMPASPSPQPSTAYAHWGLRVGSYLLDSLLVAPLFVAAVLIEAGNTTTTFDALGNSSQQTSHSAVVTALVLRLLGLAIALWNQCYRQGRTGYSVGKQVVGIKLIKESTGQPIGAWPAFGRYWLHLLDELPLFLGMLWPLWDRKRQTFADKIVGSVVVVQPKADKTQG